MFSKSRYVSLGSEREREEIEAEVGKRYLASRAR